MSSDIVLREFDEDAFDSLFVGDFDAALNLSLVQDRLVWDFSTRLGQGRINGFRPAAPDNLQDITDFSTGPTLSLPLGNATKLNLVGEVSARQFDDASRADNDSLLFLADLNRALSPTRSVGFSVSRRSVEFDDAQDSEFDFDSYFLTFASVTTWGGMTAEFGFNSVEFATDKSEGLRARLSVNRKIAAYSTLTVFAGQQLTDSGALLNQSSNGGVLARPDQIAAVNDALTRTNFGVTFSVERPRSEFDVAFAWIDDEFETQGLNDIESYQLSGGLRRRLTSRTSATVGGRFLRRDFAVAGERNDEWRVNAGLNVELTSRFSVGFDYTRRRLHATNREDFSENQYSIDFAWAISGS
ncbi:MAG: hypothetical protein AAF229_01055 [Pseudomonadota bacterium]